MKIKKVVSGLLALSIAVGSMYVVSAKDQYVTRGQVADMLLVAADDYNPNVKKEDIIQGTSRRLECNKSRGACYVKACFWKNA